MEEVIFVPEQVICDEKNNYESDYLYLIIKGQSKYYKNIKFYFFKKVNIYIEQKNEDKKI